MSEEWIKIENDSIPNARYEVTQVLQNFDGVRIELDDEVNKVSIFFENIVLALRICDEGDRLRTINRVLSNKGSGYFVGWPFYIVENSEFSNWFERETFEIKKRDSFKHYSIVTPNDVVDVLSINDPKIEVSKIKPG